LLRRGPFAQEETGIVSDIFAWGILGPGRIAARFAADLARLPDARLAAVGSRSIERAAEFAATHGGCRAHDSYVGLASDPEVDAIYVATPNPFHLEHASLCLERGKAVLCEKPMAVNAAQARRMVDCARANGVFLMEAMWTRFNPVMRQVDGWLRSGAIGEPRLVIADFCFRSAPDPESRLFSPALAGGSLLDVGTYVVSLAHWVYGRPPESVWALAHLGETGVDEQAAIALRFPGGALAQLSCAIRTSTAQEARIYGTAGAIHVPGFWRATSATLSVEGAPPVEVTGEAGYHYEAAEVAECVRAGARESARMPLDESIAIAETLDRVRALVGLRYRWDDEVQR
jgi:predicted dehydrogenase